MARPTVTPDLAYLPHTVQIGDRFRLVPSALDKQDNSNSAEPPQPMDGVVVWIHPKRRFATVEFQAKNYETMGHWANAGWKENWPIMPPEWQLAHAEPKPPRQNAPAPLSKRLQERDWSGMTSVEIAEALETIPTNVTKAIRRLEKQGIIIPHERTATARRNGATTQRDHQRKIGEYRKNAGMTQGKLASKLNVSKSAVQHWEYGDYDANWELLETALPGVTEYAKAAAGSSSPDGGK